MSLLLLFQGPLEIPPPPPPPALVPWGGHGVPDILSAGKRLAIEGLGDGDVCAAPGRRTGIAPDGGEAGIGPTPGRGKVTIH